jgi:threonine/homoserine/homoserine lactone efflux protein
MCGAVIALESTVIALESITGSVGQECKAVLEGSTMKTVSSSVFFLALLLLFITNTAEATEVGFLLVGNTFTPISYPFLTLAPA